MTKKISLLLPTRGRPDWVLRLFESIKQYTKHLEHLEVVLCIDDDDTASHTLDCDAFIVKRIIGPRNTMGHYNSACLAASSGDIVVLSNDDMVMRTTGWDERIRQVDAQYPDGIYMAYPNDLFKGAKLCTFPILPRRTCELLVDPFPKIYKGAFIDYQLLDIFKRLQKRGHPRLHYIEDVVFEHLHYRTGKSQSDATYVNRQRFGDDAAFLGLIEYRRRSADHLVAAMHGQIDATPLEANASSDITPTISAWAIVSLVLRNILTDQDIPWRWRTFLNYWFIGRTLAAQGYLRLFMR
jgi:hypothetical protein